MDQLADFEQEVRTALTHLYDPAFEPGPLLLSVLGCTTSHDVQRALLAAVERLKPPANAPLHARSHRLHAVLDYRYVCALTQEEAAARLNITPRHLRREQQEAIHGLARQLWERAAHAGAAASALPPKAPAHDGELSSDFRAQVRAELAALQQSAPGAVAAVAEVIQGAVTVAQAIAERHTVTLQIGGVAPAHVALHPTVLRQLLLTIVEKLVQQMAGGVIEFSATSADNQVMVSIQASAQQPLQPPASELIREILALQGGQLTTHITGAQATLSIHLPQVQTTPVLVIDDNQDLVHFYRRYVANTRYEIIHAAEGRQAFELAERCPPAAIVLDVMLPDADGWELLAALQRHPATAGAPIIVCSVVRRAELASTLHAALYVAKPVRRQQFLQALDQVLPL